MKVYFRRVFFLVFFTICFLFANSQTKSKFVFSQDSTIVSCKRCKLEKIPNWIFEQKKLKKIDFTHNRIAKLQDSIGLLTNLEEIILRDNRIETVNYELVKLEKLKRLNLAKNRITFISEGILKNLNLEKLELWSNVISYLPLGIENLPHLKYVDLRLNTIENKEQEYLKQKLRGKQLFFSKNCNCGG